MMERTYDVGKRMSWDRSENISSPEDKVTEGFHWFRVRGFEKKCGQNEMRTSSLRTGTHIAPSSLIPG